MTQAVSHDWPQSCARQGTGSTSSFGHNRPRAQANMKIAIAGLGYVDLSNAVLLAQHNQVVALQSKGDPLNARY